MANKIYNLGNNKGYSVLEIVETARRVTGSAIPVEACSQRRVDPAVLVADSDLAKAKLGWKPQFSNLEDII